MVKYSMQIAKKISMKGGLEMESITLIGAFGATIVGLGVAEKLGIKVNFEAVKLVVTIAGYGAIFYLIKMVAAMFLL